MLSLGEILKSEGCLKLSQNKRPTNAMVVRSCTTWNGESPLLNRYFDADPDMAHKIADRDT